MNILYRTIDVKYPINICLLYLSYRWYIGFIHILWLGDPL